MPCLRTARFSIWLKNEKRKCPKCGDKSEKDSTKGCIYSSLVVDRCWFLLGLKTVSFGSESGGHSELRVGAQAVELVRGVLLPSGGGRLTESGSDLVKCPALRLRHFEVREDEEEEQQHGEYDEDVGAAHFLRGSDEREEQLERM